MANCLSTHWFHAIFKCKTWIYNHVTLSYPFWQTWYVVLTHYCTDPFISYTLGEEGQHRTVTLYVSILGLYTTISVIKKKSFDAVNRLLLLPKPLVVINIIKIL